MSDIGPPRKEPPPSELRIGAPPRPVTRLSRRTLVVATALVTALFFAALWYALGIRPLRFADGPELYNTNAHALLSEAVNTDYPRPVATTWSVSVDRIGPDARQLFYLCAFFSPEPIAEELFLTGARDVTGPEELREVRGHRRDLADDPHHVDHHLGKLIAAHLRQIAPRHDTELCRERLEQNRDQVCE